MARYLTRAEVHDAADIVDQEGKKPSAASVHAKLQHGSNSTIQEHLASWKARPQRDMLPPLPLALTSEVATLAADLWHVALQTAAEKSQHDVNDATLATVEARTLASSLADNLDQSKAEMLQLSQKLSDLEQAAIAREAYIADILQHCETMSVENIKKDAEIETLRKLTADFGEVVEFVKNSKKAKPTVKSAEASLI